MAQHIEEYKWREFMIVLEAIQERLKQKHGKRCIFEWRQNRLNRPKSEYDF